jgi:tetratricopeptide (TPR) repeat protein
MNATLPDRARRKSLLGPGQRHLYRAVLAVSVLLLANTLYLLANRAADALGLRALAVTSTDLPAFYQTMILSHTGLGVLLFALAMGLFGWHLRRAWGRRHGVAVWSGAATVTIASVLLVSGLLIVREAQRTALLPVFWAHVAAAALLPVLFGVHRLRSHAPPSRRSVVLTWGSVLAVLLVFLGVHLGTSSASRPQGLREDVQAGRGPASVAGSRERSVPLLPDTSFIGAAYVPPDSPFFPSAATTTTGAFLPARILTRGDRGKDEELQRDLAEFGFAMRTLVGATTCQRCHADIVEQWSKSAHRYASFNNPFYEASVNEMRKTVGKVKSKWCSGCHDPALMLADKMDKEIDRVWPEAQAGLTCLGCHAIDSIHNQTGNGNYNIADEQESPYLFDKTASAGGLRRFLHDTILKAKPTVHKRMMLKPFFRTGEFCGTCHKVNLDVAVNDYRWIRGQDEYDAWHDSGVAHNAARTFYLPPQAKLCQDCHMPPEPAVLGDVSAKNGMVRSHRFLAVNTALPFVRGDQDTIRRIEAFLKEKLRVEVFALRRGPDFNQPVMDLSDARPALVPGETVHFDVVVRNQGVGHTFPGGTNDSNEGWLELTVTDERGRSLAQSGLIGPDGQVDGAAHFFRALLSDRNGAPIHMRNAQDIYTPVYVNVIGPGTADVARFRFRVPDSGVKAVRVRARVLWRKFERHFTEFVFQTNEAMRARFGGRAPDLPVTELALNEVELPVLEAGAGAPAPAAVAQEADWTRFNDYGIGLLLQGETAVADKAFARVAELAPKRVDGPRNRARVAIAEGNLPQAYELLRRCEELSPGDARSAWDWGNALQDDGRYEASAQAFRRVLEEFPNDRATWRSLGRTLYLDGKLDEALSAFERVLQIDPEDRVAHYHRMLILKAQGKTELAAAAEQAYQKYKLDENAPAVTKEYRLAHPYDNRESLRIHVHDLTRPEEGLAAERTAQATAPSSPGAGS